MIQTIKNDKLVKILTERGKLFKELGVINEELIKLDKDRKKIGYKMDKLKDKTSVIMDKEKIELGEFDIISRVFIENGECKVEIVDRVEEFKKQLKEDSNKK